MATPDTSIVPQRLFKVVMPAGKPAHGGRADFTWPLPKGKKPGAWIAIEGALALCENALHLTPSPIDWYQRDAELYEAEYRGEVIDGRNKIGCREARLIRLVDWDKAQVFTTGEHAVTNGRALAYGSATVEAYGSATVEAYGSATVRAYGSATVEAYGSATVRAYGSATIVSTTYHHPGDFVTLSELAVHVDRREAKVMLRAARGELGTVQP